VLLDRDGTIVVDRGYLSDPDGLELIRGAGPRWPACVSRDSPGHRLQSVRHRKGIPGRGGPGAHPHEALRSSCEAWNDAGRIYCWPASSNRSLRLAEKPETVSWPARRRSMLRSAEASSSGTRLRHRARPPREATTILVRTGYGEEAAATPPWMRDHCGGLSGSGRPHRTARWLPAWPDTGERGEPLKSSARSEVAAGAPTASTAPLSRRGCPLRVPPRY